MQFEFSMATANGMRIEAKQGGSIVGHLYYCNGAREDTLVLKHLYTMPGMRKRGVASRLVNTLPVPSDKSKLWGEVIHPAALRAVSKRFGAPTEIFYCTATSSELVPFKTALRLLEQGHCGIYATWKAQP